MITSFIIRNVFGARCRVTAPPAVGYSTNVYADLGYKSAGEMFLNAQLVTMIAEILTEGGYTQTKGPRWLALRSPSSQRCYEDNFAASRSAS